LNSAREEWLRYQFNPVLQSCRTPPSSQTIEVTIASTTELDETAFKINDYTKTAEKTEAAAVEVRGLTTDFRQRVESDSVVSLAGTFTLCGVVLSLALAGASIVWLPLYRQVSSTGTPTRSKSPRAPPAHKRHSPPSMPRGIAKLPKRPLRAWSFRRRSHISHTTAHHDRGLPQAKKEKTRGTFSRSTW